MTQMNTDVVDNNETSHLDDDPGAFPFPCGEFAGKRLDTVSSKLRWWATQAHLARNSWYPAYMKANNRYEELLLQTPEAYPLPFGEHEGKRLDEVSEDLIWWGIHPLRSGTAWHQNLVEASRLYLDKVYDQKSPGSVVIWFGKQYKGHRFDEAYNRPGFIRFCLQPELNKCFWYYRFKDLVQRYEAHLQTHRRPYRPRAPARVENPAGQLLGRWDDSRGSVEPDDDYERDGFVVDDDEEIYYEDGSDFEPTDDTDDPAVDDDSDGHEEEDADSESTENSDADQSVAQAEGSSPSRASATISQTSDPDLDDDIPLEELRNKTKKKRLSEGKVTSSNSRQRIYHSSSGEETDTADQRPLKRLRRRRSEHEVQRSAQTDSHSDLEPAAPDEPENPHCHQLSQSLSVLSMSQESPDSPCNDDELPCAPRKSVRLQGKSARREFNSDDSDTPEYNIHTNTPSRLGRGYRVLVQSDDEE
ncbi:hypothetical protein EDD22DRAFT_962263 [Suillus occidentalis]|nr:hypothetical protein EDD22DRAFT_962263 [Suillus occidentalis]